MLSDLWIFNFTYLNNLSQTLTIFDFAQFYDRDFLIKPLFERLEFLAIRGSY